MHGRLVGLPRVRVLAVEEAPLRVHVETRIDVIERCPACGTPARVKDRDRVALTDLPCFGRRAKLVWHKRRWRCPQQSCPTGSWTETAPPIAASRLKLTDRAGRWVTFQVGCHGRTIAEVTADLGCDWHTVNDAVVAYGRRLVDDPHRIGTVTALGLDETLFVKRRRWRTKQWPTSIVAAGQLLDVVQGRDAGPAMRWLAARTPAWREQIRWATLDMSGPYRKVFDRMLPHATQVADPFHQVRRRVQNETLGEVGWGAAGRPADWLATCEATMIPWRSSTMAWALALNGSVKLHCALPLSTATSAACPAAPRWTLPATADPHRSPQRPQTAGNRRIRGLPATASLVADVRAVGGSTPARSRRRGRWPHR